MRARLSTVLPVSLSPHENTFVRLERVAKLLPDHEFSEVLGDFISTNFESDAKITNLADCK